MDENAYYPSIDHLTETKWETCVAAIERLPDVRKKYGMDAAIQFGRTQVRRAIDELCRTQARTPELVHAKHRIHMSFTEGYIRVMARDDRAGQNLRTAIEEAIERWILSHSIVRTFEKGQEQAQGYRAQIDQSAQEQDD